MRITFVLPFLTLTGGVRVVHEYASRLRRRGHEVRVVFPLVPYRFRGPRALLPRWRVWAGDWRLHALHRRRLPGSPEGWWAERVPMIREAFMPDADVVVATAWPTAYSVSRLGASKGAGCYLIQHREIDSGEPERVDGTYRLGLFHLAGSRSTARELEGRLGVPVHAVVPSGVDAAFWSAAVAGAARRGVLWAYSPAEHKGGADGEAALAEVHRAMPEARIRAFGQARRPQLPGFIEYVARPRDPALRELYAGAEVFLYSSRFEGFGLPPLEAQAAGCGVVSTRVGDVPEFIRDGENGLLVEPRDVTGMAAAVLALLQQPERRERLGAAAASSAALHDWDQSEIALEQAFEHAIARAHAGSAHAQG
jgi:glycosyltransferase involved in cell wall biosynthesis